MRGKKGKGNPKKITEKEKKEKGGKKRCLLYGRGGFLNLYFYLILCYSGFFFMVLAHIREEF